MELDPVTAGPVVTDRRVAAEVIARLRPSRLGDPEVDHAWALRMSNLPAPGEDGWLVTEAGATFTDRAGTTKAVTNASHRSPSQSGSLPVIADARRRAMPHTGGLACPRQRRQL
jgi:hypothetical protein